MRADALNRRRLTALLGQLVQEAPPQLPWLREPGLAPGELQHRPQALDLLIRLE